MSVGGLGPSANPPGYTGGVDIWCGKAYHPDQNSFQPGGWLSAPAVSSSPLLDLQVYPRMNIYIGDESSASFIVSADVSSTVGVPYCTNLPGGSGNSSNMELQISISRTDTGATVVPKSTVTINSTSHEFDFPLSGFEASTTPYGISIKATTACGGEIQQKQTLSVLPPRSDGGSVTKVDYLNGGLLYQESSNSSWTPVFPFGYFANWDGLFAVNTSAVADYANLGFNVIHPEPDTGSTPFDETDFNTFLDELEAHGLLLMYDMRYTYLESDLIAEQVNQLKSRKSILLWYTADEPDGFGDPLNGTYAVYNQIKQLDPYHPTSLVLNCYNHYYANYTSGADIVMADPYPVGVNVSFSTRYGTLCNTTYGCCGCDDCKGNLRDVSERMDVMKMYESILGGTANGRNPKSFWGTPQVFGGAEFWPREPTTQEEAVMVMLFINHGAQGIVGWQYPTPNDLTNVTSQMAKTLTSNDTTSYLLGARPVALEVDGSSVVDAAGWLVGNKMLVCAIYTDYDASQSKTTLQLPGKVTNIQPLWSISQEQQWNSSGNTLVKPSFTGLEVSIMLVDMVDVNSTGTTSSSSSNNSNGGSGSSKSLGTKVRATLSLFEVAFTAVALHWLSSLLL